MGVSYMAADGTPHFGSANALVAEFDRKLTVMLDGKSPLLLMPEQLAGPSRCAHLLGNIFSFGNGAVSGTTFTKWHTAYTSVIGVPVAAFRYDHAACTTAAENALEVRRDAESKWMAVQNAGLPLYASLEAHKREDGGVVYWLNELHDYGAQFVEKEHDFAVAELVFESAWGSEPLTEYDFPETWRKYSCYRIHNLSGESLVVRFGGITITVPRWGCKAVRRVGNSWNEGWNYFWPHIPGDPLFFTHIPGAAPAVVWNTHRVNNLTHLAVLHDWIDATLAGECRFFRNPQVVNDCYPEYAEFFGNPDAPETLLGDLLHTKGRLDWVSDSPGVTEERTELRFDGWASFATLLNMAGIEAEADDGEFNFRVRATRGQSFDDLVGLGTNVLRAAGATNGSLDIHEWAILPTTVIEPQWQFVRPPRTRTTEVEYFWWELPTPTQGPRQKFLRVPLTTLELPPIAARDTVVKAHNTTVAEMLTLNWLGSGNEVSGQNNAYGRFTDRRLMLTPQGLQLQWTQRITPGASLQGSEPGTGLYPEGDTWIEPEGNMMAFLDTVGLNPPRLMSVEDGEIVLRTGYTWEGYGWPTTTARMFLSPRAGPRNYLPFRLADDLPWDNPVIRYRYDGQDFTLHEKQEFEGFDVTLMTPVELHQRWGLGVFGMWRSPDALVYYYYGAYPLYRGVISTGSLGEPPLTRDAFMPWAPFLPEVYNALAARVNSLVGCRPFSFEMMWFRDLLGGAIQYRPNTVGMFGTPFCPRAMYRGGDAAGSRMSAWAVAQGLRTRYVEDAVPGWREFLDVTAKRATIEWDYHRYISQSEWVISHPEPSIGGYIWDYTESILTEPVENLELKIVEVGGHTLLNQMRGYNASFQVTDNFRWVNIDDVHALAVSLGFRFSFRQVSALYGVLDATAVGMSVVWQKPASTEGPTFYNDIYAQWSGMPDPVNKPIGQVVDGGRAGSASQIALGPLIGATSRTDAPLKVPLSGQIFPLLRPRAPGSDVINGAFGTGSNVYARVDYSGGEDFMRAVFPNPVMREGTLAMLVQRVDPGNVDGSIQAIGFARTWADISENNWASASKTNAEIYFGRFKDAAWMEFIPLKAFGTTAGKSVLCGNGETVIQSEDEKGWDMVFFDGRMEPLE